MYFGKQKLWEDENSADYAIYLQDNSEEIEDKRRHPAMIVCGGGGYMGISDREKEPVALFFLNEGFQVFVLEYGTSKTGRSIYPEPVYDLAKMVATVRKYAGEWNIDADKVAVIGFSAGAHLCASLATQWQEHFLSERLQLSSEQMRPDAVILAYPMTDCVLQREWALRKTDLGENSPSLDGVSVPMAEYMEESNQAMFGKHYTEADLKQASPVNHVTERTPPVFLWHTASDEMVWAVNSLVFTRKLLEAGVDCELHLFEKGPHGMSLANKQSGGSSPLVDPEVSIWKELAVRFLNRHFQKQDRTGKMR